MEVFPCWLKLNLLGHAPPPSPTVGLERTFPLRLVSQTFSLTKMWQKTKFAVRRKSKFYEIFANQFRNEAKIQVSRNIRETIFMSTLQHASFLFLNYPLGLASRAGGGGGRKQNVFPFSVPSWIFYGGELSLFSVFTSYKLLTWDTFCTTSS